MDALSWWRGIVLEWQDPDIRKSDEDLGKSHCDAVLLLERTADLQEKGFLL